MNRRLLGCLFEVLEALLFTLVIFLVIQMFVAQPYQVKQESMENTLMPDQFVLVDKLTPQFSEYHRGDVIVFNPPPGWTQDSSGAPFIKRVIGIGGDSVDIHGGHVFLNGVQISEPYVFDGQPTQLPTETGKTWKLASDELFVMGDHRQASEDSRQFGPINKSTVIGRAWIRYWPLDQFGFLPRATQSAAPSASSAASPKP